MAIGRSSLTKLLGFAGGLVCLTATAASAVELADGKTYFTSPPRLEGASATQNTAYFWGSTYYFTLILPDNAGEPLQSVRIRQEASPDYPRFDLRDTRAYEGPRNRLGAELPLKNVTFDPQTRDITITFDQPVAPGRTVTIGLYATRNPDVGGVYLYGVTAFPAGAQPYGQFLGYGRIQIYDSGMDSSWFFRR